MAGETAQRLRVLDVLQRAWVSFPVATLHLSTSDPDLTASSGLLKHEAHRWVTDWPVGKISTHIYLNRHRVYSGEVAIEVIEKVLCQARRFSPVSPAVRSLRQEDHRFKPPPTHTYTHTKELSNPAGSVNFAYNVSFIKPCWWLFWALPPSLASGLCRPLVTALLWVKSWNFGGQNLCAMPENKQAGFVPPPWQCLERLERPTVT